tara:strand:+ start:834 stop:1007 length:174 start_codon:yes stop_codon:yes gene_type:complete
MSGLSEETTTWVFGVDEKARTAAWQSLRRARTVRLDRRAAASDLEFDTLKAMASFVV